jgi:methionyl-tRNA synthetase
MYTALQVAAGLSILSEPLLPFTAQKLRTMLQLKSKSKLWEQVAHGDTLLQPKHLLGASALLFQKIEDDQMESERSKLRNAAQNNKEEQKKATPLKPQVEASQFETLDLRVAEILEAKKVKKTKKLMELTVLLGEEKRTVVSGIANDYDETELIGKKVTLLVNLKPRALKGIESQGMILLGENEAGKLIFVAPEDTQVRAGTPIK